MTGREAGEGIEVVSVARAFGRVRAVTDMTFSAPAGRVTALVGPNGSGKTTLMLMVAGLLEPDAGSVRVGGFDPTREAAAVRARLGWMPDVFGAWDALTVTEHLAVFADAYRLPRDVAAARVPELLATVRLEPLADAPARVLSRGQKQRLGLARALVHDPSVLVLDEPASGLDPGSRIELRHVLRGLADEGCCVLVSSHVLSELDDLADDAVFVLGGRTVAADPAAAGGRSGAGAARLGWRLRALDQAALLAALADRGLLAAPAPGGAVEVVLAGEREAAALLRDLVGAGVPLTHFAPTAGRIEQAYLGLTASPAGQGAER
ncbi:ABC transporter ATP-binding protein [Aquipuribacter nitratireducens]|uniref:ABC transporter ATP-binding protein n=1 Tax=Aquipuribacter nitratireducens TaxID=650104 RepID=A0ABW0GPN2_9MICO